MLDRLAIHVKDKQCPSGVLAKLTGRNQLSVEARNSPSRSARLASQVRRSVNLKRFPVDQIASYIPHKDIATILLRIGRASIDGDAGRGSKKAGREPIPSEEVAVTSPGPRLAGEFAKTRHGSAGLIR